MILGEVDCIVGGGVIGDVDFSMMNRIAHISEGLRQMFPVCICIFKIKNIVFLE